ncbi:MAG: gamma-glutamyl-phosphate reductase, partial [Cyanobacteriota bacterium]|nr:gamma-glutamyl-phosphate reductase [Cyanobacteriota bacterium]
MAALQRAFQQSDLSPDCLLSLTEAEGEAARTWLLQEPGIDLMIPYGRPGLVQQVIRQAAVPVLPTVIGNGYLYWAASGKLATVIQMVVDSHRGEPDAVNALEKILVDAACSPSLLSQFCNSLWEGGFELLGDEALVMEVAGLKLAKSADWSQPFLTKTVTLRRVDHLDAAANWINQYGSGHVSALVSDVHHEVCR